jgi:pyrimidine operon attenuation protein/uracil phosphoribosyltransferase
VVDSLGYQNPLRDRLAGHLSSENGLLIKLFQHHQKARSTSVIAPFLRPKPAATSCRFYSPLRFPEKNLPKPTLPLPKRSAVPTSPKSLSPSEIHAAIERLAVAIGERHSKAGKILLLGIANGGIVLAHRLAAKLPHARVGTLDISFHRDDISRHPIPKEFAPTQIPVDVHGATVILVDDVLFSGRTVKAALDELFDHGRPEKVELAVLIDRGHRRVPFAADYIGLILATLPSQKVVVVLDATDPNRDRVRVEASAPAAP